MKSLYCSFPLTSWVFSKVYSVLFSQGAEAQQEPAADNYYNEARLISDLFLTNPDADVIRLEITMVQDLLLYTWDTLHSSCQM